MSQALVHHAAVRASAAVSLRNPQRVARRLLAFAHTEQGSGLDMLRAAERVDDARLRRLFLLHGIDELRHARLFREAAWKLAPALRGSEYDVVRARRQDLFERLGIVEFIAFVYLAEREGAARFAALRDHFADHVDLHRLFRQIAAEEKFHVSYSRRQLRDWTRAGRGAEVRRALVRVRARSAWEAWRRAGRRIGDVVATGLLGALLCTVIPLFAVLQRRMPARTGWQVPRGGAHDLASASEEV